VVGPLDGGHPIARPGEFVSLSVAPGAGRLTAAASYSSALLVRPRPAGQCFSTAGRRDVRRLWLRPRCGSLWGLGVFARLRGMVVGFVSPLLRGRATCFPTLTGWRTSCGRAYYPLKGTRVWFRALGPTHSRQPGQGRSFTWSGGVASP